MAVRDVQTPRFRAEEKSRKAGVTFADLCELVEKGRAAGIDPAAVVVGDYYITGTPKGRDGYRTKWLEV
ncbi:hypothetical protein ACF06P_35395 [Streptomyces sp. NPDC015684]|uniref:hypothetical protein n=1 Tax=Streptomyces sp. NPDC015684 TaxID=3364963 RepID=UPI0036FA5AED